MNLAVFLFSKLRLTIQSGCYKSAIENVTLVYVVRAIKIENRSSVLLWFWPKMFCSDTSEVKLYL